MGTTEWLQDSPLVKRLLNEYFDFSFFQAVSLLESFYNIQIPQMHKTEHPEKELLKFSVIPSRTFPPNKGISGLTIENEAPVKYLMNVSFMGLIGPSGVLPEWYDFMAYRRYHLIYKSDYYNKLEKYQEQEKQSYQYGLVDFLNIFHHRLLSLFYLAWKNSQIQNKHYKKFIYSISAKPAYEKKQDKQLDILFSGFSRFFSQIRPSVHNIQTILSFFTQQQIQIEQFIPQLTPVSTNDQIMIGKRNNVLGNAMVCGNKVWDCQTKFRILMGPASFDDMLDYLPDHSRRPSKKMIFLYKLVRMIVGQEYEFDISLVIKKGTIYHVELHKSKKLNQKNMLGLVCLQGFYLKNKDQAIKITFQENSIMN